MVTANGIVIMYSYGPRHAKMSLQALVFVISKEALTRMAVAKP